MAAEIALRVSYCVDNPDFIAQAFLIASIIAPEEGGIARDARICHRHRNSS